MKTDRLSIIILSCDNFSDLWDGQVEQIDKYWGNRNIPTYLVTETIMREYPTVRVITAGKNTEFSERIKQALSYVDSDYVLVTLDDYYLKKTVDEDRIHYLINIMDQDKVDYIRLYKRPMRAQGKKLRQYKKLYEIKNSINYSVNLCVGIFRREFLLGALESPQSPWQLEVSFSAYATNRKARCYVSRYNEYVILDVVRKGKILNKAHRYFKKNGIYYGNREVQSKMYEFKLGVRTFFARHMPLPIVKLGKKVMRKMGKHYFSDF